MNYLLTTLLAATSADAWHGGVHHVTGNMLALLNAPDSKVRQFVDNALVAGSADINGGCDFNNYASAASFPDDIKNSQYQMSDWHWNDIKGHLSYYIDSEDKLQVAESKMNGDLIPATERGLGFASCVDKAGCYGLDGVAGMRQAGECALFLKDFEKNVLKNGTGAGSQGGFATVAYSRGFLVRHAMHFVGDSHMPLHNGSMFSKAGLDPDCCPTGYVLNGDGLCAMGGDILPEPQDSQCSGLDNPRLWCHKQGDYDSLDGVDGDQGGNKFSLKFNAGMWGPFREVGSSTQMHYIWDAAFGLFETTTTDRPDEPWLVCNEDANGNLKRFPVTEYSQNGNQLVEETADYWLNETRGAATYATPEFASSLYCHAEKLIEDYPRDQLQSMMQQTMIAALKDYYGSADSPSIPAGYFNPDNTDIDQWQDEMNWTRHHLVYKPFFTLPTGVKGADCPDTGVAAYPLNWWDHSRKLSRAFAALSGYRLDAFMNKVAADYEPSPLQTYQGTYDSVCYDLKNPDSAIRPYATLSAMVGSVIYFLLF